MRILHVISGLDPENGGPTFALVGMAEAQRRAGLDVSVIATWQIRSGFPLAERLRRAGVNVELIGQAHGKLSRHPDLASAVDSAVAAKDVVHIHALWEEIQHQAAAAAQRRGVPYVITPHGMLSPWSRSQGSFANRWGKRLYMAARLRRNLDRAAAINFTTAAERDLVAPLRLAPRSILEPVGIDLAEFDVLPEPDTFRCRYPILAGRTMLLFLSRLSVQKGLDYLIPAFAECARTSGTDAVLVIAGPDYDGYRRVVENLVDEHALRHRVLFTGMLHGGERIEAMRDADLFVLPSRHENFGIVVAESLAAGVPVVISNEVNIHAEVTAAGVGAAVPPDAGPLARELARWLNDPALRRAAAGKTQEFVRERYDWNTIAAHWLGHYESLTKSAGKQSASAS